MKVIVTVCALTYKRPEGLRRLLDGFLKLEKDDDWSALRFVIVDNDAQGSGKDLCLEFQQEGKLGTALRYVSQPVQGIARSRNAAVDAAADGDWTAFIDDDECPDPDWLRRLYRGALKHKADVVGGPVRPIIEGTPAPWLAHGGFFERRKYEDGTNLGHVFTNNVLFRSSLPRELNIRFDERPAFASLCVGEDRLFFQALAKAGAKTVYCSDAFVTEWIPEARANEAWLVNRMHKIGVATTAVELSVHPGIRTKLILLAKALVWMMIGALRFLALGFLDPLTRTKARRNMAYGRGLIVGMMNYSG